MKNIGSLLLLIALALTACDTHNAPPAAAPPAERGIDDSAQMQEAGAANPGSRLLIYNGSLALAVESTKDALAEAARIAESHGGFVSDTSTSSNDSGFHHGKMIIRIPSQEFETAMAQLQTLGNLRRYEIKTEDITRAYRDLEGRLRVKRETEARFHELLKTRAAKLEDILAAEREIGRIVEEIESLEGERRYYENQLNLSTITVFVTESSRLDSGLWAPVHEALISSGEVLGESLAGLVYFVAFAFPWFLIGLLIWRLVLIVLRRRRAQSRSGS